jgi:hypothetical protein
VGAGEAEKEKKREKGKEKEGEYQPPLRHIFIFLLLSVPFALFPLLAGPLLISSYLFLPSPLFHFPLLNGIQ